MDNPRLIIVSKGLGNFERAMRLAFVLDGYENHPSKAKWWGLWTPKTEQEVQAEKYPCYKQSPCTELGVVETAPFLVLYSYASGEHEGKVDPKLYTKLPYEMETEAATVFAWGWLQQQEWKNEPDHDGSNSKGFCLWNDVWGHVAGQHGAIIAIGPAWAMHGK